VRIAWASVFACFCVIVVLLFRRNTLLSGMYFASLTGRVADKLGVTGNVQVALDSSKPEAIAVAAAAAMHGHALLHIGDAAASVDGAIVIDDAALA